MRETTTERAVSEMGAKNLWKAVLEQAFKDAQGQVGTYEYRRDARVWFQSDSKDIGSFLWICEVLDLDPEVTRASVDHGVNITPPYMRDFSCQESAFMAAL